MGLFFYGIGHYSIYSIILYHIQKLIRVVIQYFLHGFIAFISIEKRIKRNHDSCCNYFIVKPEICIRHLIIRYNSYKI